MKLSLRSSFVLAACCALSLVPARALAQSPQILDPDATRYMALGDSISAGYKAMPVTNGFVYLLYQDGVFDRIPHTLFCNAAVPGATSFDVLTFQVPQVGRFVPGEITLTVGGNDLLGLLEFAATHSPDETIVEAQKVLTDFGNNLAGILIALRGGFPNARVFVGNLYTIPELEVILPVTGAVIDNFNAVVAQVVNGFPGVFLVDVHAAFLGRNSLLQVERHGASLFEVHPTSVGHRVIEKAFADVIAVNK